MSGAKAPSLWGEFIGRHPDLEQALSEAEKSLTEGGNPRTASLDTMAKEDMQAAVRSILEIDLEALEEARTSGVLEALAEAAKQLKEQGGQLIMGGCGASGRILLLMLTYLREAFPGDPLLEKIIVLMAGGDVAMFNTVERFEDDPTEAQAQYDQQVKAAPGDMAVFFSASGRAVFIWACAEKVLQQGGQVFIVCANDLDNVRRWAAGIDAQDKLPFKIMPLVDRVTLLTLGGKIKPAIAGSSRLHPTTQMLSACHAMINALFPMHARAGSAQTLLTSLLKDKASLALVAEYANFFAAALQENKQLVFNVSGQPRGALFLAFFQDLTELTPTFNLPPIAPREIAVSAPVEHISQLTPCLPDVEASDTLSTLFGPSPVCLNHPDFPATSTDYMRKFEFSTEAAEVIVKHSGRKPENMSVTFGSESVSILFARMALSLPYRDTDVFSALTLLKVVLNACSTAAMAKNGRVLGNTMLCVIPTNVKLVLRLAALTKAMIGDTVDHERLKKALERVVNRAEQDRVSGTVSKTAYPILAFREYQALEQIEERASGDAVCAT